MAQDENLKGVSRLIVKLKAMGAMDDGNVLKEAVREGMTPVLIQAIATVPDSTLTRDKPHRVYTGELVGPGYARRNIKLFVSLSKDKTSAIATVGPTKRAYYVAQYLERGHFTRAGTATGTPRSRTARQNRGREKSGDAWIPARPWLRPAFYQNQNRLKENMTVTFQRFLNNLWSDPVD